MSQKKGILLINLGTPDSFKIKDLRRYLREFLFDPRILVMPSLWRFLLLHLIILPTRPKKIQANYKKIWMKDGSPLDVYAKRLTRGVSENMGDRYRVEYAMRYGQPGIPHVLNRMIARGITDVYIVPLFPQYAMATVGTVYAKIFDALKDKEHIPSISLMPSYYDTDFFIDAQAKIMERYVKKPYDHVVFTYHGLPKKHLTHCSDSGQKQCYKKNCCSSVTSANSFCYRAHCHATSFKLAEKLTIPAHKYTVCFQSRFGREEWIKPYTTEVLKTLAKTKKRVIVACPAFTADCVETLDEISREERETFMKHGGEEFDVVPCVNDSPLWIKGLSDEIKRVF